MTVVPLAGVVVLCFLPALLFLGLWHGLARMQRGSLTRRVIDRADCADPAVTWGDVVDAYADPQRRLFGPSSGSSSGSATLRDEQCSACATTNDPVASFCHNCFRKLE